jgi:hypothetical protein
VEIYKSDFKELDRILKEMRFSDGLDDQVLQLIV